MISAENTNGQEKNKDIYLAHQTGGLRVAFEPLELFWRPAKRSKINSKYGLNNSIRKQKRYIC
jgi:hypothetical protein